LQQGFKDVLFLTNGHLMLNLERRSHSSPLPFYFFFLFVPFQAILVVIDGASEAGIQETGWTEEEGRKRDLSIPPYVVRGSKALTKKEICYLSTLMEKEGHTIPALRPPLGGTWAEMAAGKCCWLQWHLCPYSATAAKAPETRHLIIATSVSGNYSSSRVDS
jgi:hypothetical protein